MVINRIVYTSNILTDLCFTKRNKNKNKKYFSNSFLLCFSSKNVLTKHKEYCFSINGVQCAELEKGMIEFRNHFKQIPVPFKIYANFESNLESLEY